jgi:hypothetical protein
MRSVVFLIITGFFSLFTPASAGAEPIFQLNDCSTSKSGIDYTFLMNNCLISLDDFDNSHSSLHYPFTKASDAQAIEPEMVIAGMWVLQSEDVALLRRAGKQIEDLLIPIFAGSFLISLSNFIRKLGKEQPLTHREKAPVKTRVSYEKTLWAESQGLM